MKIVKTLSIATILLSATSIAHATAYAFTDRGLNYSIDTTNPLLAKITIEGTSLNALATTATDTSSWNGNSASVTVNSFTLAIPKIGPTGLQVSSDGTAYAPAYVQPVQAQISGTYSDVFSSNGVNYSTNGSWTQLATFNLSTPFINVWDFPNSAPLLSSYSAYSYDSINVLDLNQDVSIGGVAGVLSIGLGISGISVDELGNTQFSIYNNAYLSSTSPTPTVPIPSSILLFSSGLVGLVTASRRKVK